MKWMSLLIGALACLTELAWAADENLLYPAAGDESAKYRQEVLIEALNNPAGLVICPPADNTAPQQMFFTESGAGRVLAFDTERPTASREVLNGWKTRELSENVPLDVGPWSLGFLTPNKLAVWGGIKEVGVYVLPSDERVLKAADVNHLAHLPQENPRLAEGAFPGMVVGETHAYLSSGSAENIGTIFKAALIANSLDSPRTLTPSKQSSQMQWPTGLCLSPAAKTQFLVAAYVGELLGVRDSRVAFIVPSHGEIALEVIPGLFDVVGLAYSPSGQLYAVDFAWQEEKSGGVYRLDYARLEERSSCRAVKIADIVHPTSLLFDAAGTAMYVTSFGPGTNAKRGSLIKITGEF